MSQDAKQGFDGKWAFNKYDAFGRLVITGVTTNNVSRANWAVIINADTTVMSEERSDSNPNGTGYTNQKQPSVGLADCMNIIYYDDYGFYGNTGGYAPQSVISGKLKGMVTGVRSRVINGAMLLSVGYYDDEGRMVETVEDNHLGGKDRVLLRYNFAGELLNTVRTHTDGVATTSVANAYTYDQMGRSILTKQNINNDGGITLSRLGYNELGQPREKSLHSTDNGSTFKQSTQYAYNERGWLKSSRSPQFSYKLGYDTLGSGIARYNGDISIKQWGSENSYPNKFLYGYDGMDRLTSAVSTGVAMSETLTYNAMGNIATLTRDGVTGTYNYNGAGNRLNLISGGSMATNSYSYDQRGRVTTDGRTGFSLTYNNLGLTHTANKASAGVYHSYVHDAMGNRLSRTVVTPADTTVSDYLGGIHYTNGEIEFIQTEEGRAIKSGDKYVYQYDLSDYLGNVRYSFDIYEGSVRRLQGDDYYAFGLRKPVSPVSLDNRYLYNGKELQEHLGQYDYGARFYDPSIGRWLATDPLTELAPSLTPFRYGFNSPVNYTDPYGLFEQGKDPKPSKNDEGIHLKPVEIFGPSRGGGNFPAWQWIWNPIEDNGYTDPYGGGGGGGGGSKDKVNQLKEVVIKGKRRGGYDWGTVGNALIAGGVSYYGLEKSLSNSKYWVDTKGAIRPTALLKKGAAGKYVRGVQGLRNSQVAATKVASKYAVAGKVVGGLGMGVTVIQYGTGQISGTETSVDLIMGGIGFTGWGAPVSLIYFGGKFIYEYSTGNTLFEKPGGR